MGNSPHVKWPKGSVHRYRKLFQEKRKDKNHSQTRTDKTDIEEKHLTTEREVSEATLRRLHTLGSQKFGSSPFSQHFERWVASVETVLGDFESHPNITVDKTFLEERNQILDSIKLELEHRKRTEESLDREISNLLACKQQLAQINRQYAASSRIIKSQKYSAAKRLGKLVSELKMEQDEVIRMKAGFFKPISKKGREKLEIQVTQQLSDKQRELELATLESNTKLRALREEYEEKREPVLEQIKVFRKTIRHMETDDSLEERWFACEALIDAVNNFLQRKTAKPQSQS